MLCKWCSGFCQKVCSLLFCFVVGFLCLCFTFPTSPPFFFLESNTESFTRGT